MQDILSQDKLLQSYACPECLGGIEQQNNNALYCDLCKKEYIAKEGIQYFIEDPVSFDWGIAPKRLAQMLNEAKDLSWHDAMINLCSALPFSQAQKIWARTLGHRRASLQALLPLGPDATVLDFGSGWGTIATHLAQSAREVVAYDQALLHLQWLKAVMDDKKIDNIRLVLGGPTRHLPFPYASFDVIVLNGAFEWVATNAGGDPQAYQQRMLNELSRILKPNGVLFIGIENRLNYKYFLGVHEGHIKMRFGALLPRRITNWYLQRYRKQAYRQYTYSLYGYHNLFENAGINKVKYFAPWPNYGEVVRVFPAAKLAQSDTWKVNSRHPACHWPSTLFSRAYSMIASKGSPPPTVIDGVLNEIASAKKMSLPLSVEGQLYRMTSAGKALIQITDQNNKKWQAQIGLSDFATNGIERQYQAAQWLSSQSMNDSVKKLFGEPPIIGRYKSFVWSLRPFIEGSSAVVSVDGRNKKRHKKMCEQVLDFLDEFHRTSGKEVIFDENHFEQYVGSLFADVRRWFTAAEWVEVERWFLQQKDWLRTQLVGSKIWIVAQHGDFAPENCLIDSNNNLCGVLDWEHFEENNLALFDLINFILRAYRGNVIDQLWKDGINASNIKFHGYPAIFINGAARNWLLQYFKRFNINEGMVKPFVFIWWLKKLQLWAPLRLYDPTWRRFRIFPIIERLKHELLSTQTDGAS